MHTDLLAAINRLNEAHTELVAVLNQGPQRHTPTLELVLDQVGDGKERLIEIHNEQKQEGSRA